MLDDTPVSLPPGFRDPTRVSNVSTADLKKIYRVAPVGTIPCWTLCRFFGSGRCRQASFWPPSLAATRHRFIARVRSHSTFSTAQKSEKHASFASPPKSRQLKTGGLIFACFACFACCALHFVTMIPLPPRAISSISSPLSYLAEIIRGKPFALPNQELRLSGHQASEGEAGWQAEGFRPPLQHSPTSILGMSVH